jgi:predicted nucleic acid-binding protein
MPQVCVDASLVLTLVLPDERSEYVQALWSQWIREQISPFGPPLLYAEVPAVLRQAVFNGRLTFQAGDVAFQDFCDLGIPISTKPNLHLLAWELAKTHNRPRAYDTMYLAAAQAEGCDLWTGDRRLVNAVNLPWVKWVGQEAA